jgi:hypothetical protein
MEAVEYKIKQGISCSTLAQPMSYPDLISVIAVNCSPSWRMFTAFVEFRDARVTVTRENVSGGNNLKDVVLIFPLLSI